MMRRLLCVGMTFLVGALFGCNGTHTGNPVDEGPTDPVEQVITPLEKITKVDILFVMDDSGSMDEHEALALEMPRLIRALVTGDRDGDGKAELEPAESVHLGVVSSDLGLPGVEVSPDPEDKCRGLGDDGVLRHEAETAPEDCEGPFPPFVAHELDEDDPDQTAHDFGCMLRLGIGGCGFEQQLEAALKALWPSDDESIIFLTDDDGSGAHGHGDAENAGFLRDDSLLAVVVVTDEDDCSTESIHIFEDASASGAEPEIGGQPLNLRCYYNSDVLHPIERYVDGFKALRPDMEDRVIFGVIGGVPPELVEDNADLLEHVLGKVEADPGELEALYASILEHEDMQPTIIPEGKDIFGKPWENLMPACYVENLDYDPTNPASEPFISKAQPARRLVQMAEAFGANGVVQSICQETLTPQVQALVTALTNRMIESSEQDE